MSGLELFQQHLRELFQIDDTADLDFGIYRLFAARRAEVEKFINDDLPAEVESAFAEMISRENTEAREKLEEFRQRIINEIAEDALLPDGSVKEDYADTPVKSARELIQEYKDLRAKCAEARAVEEQKTDTYNHLYAFFARYYDDGDFIPRHFYGSRHQYVLPYNGEETVFHWANKDQYYVKSGEYFRNYAFEVNTLGGRWRVRFEIVEASIPPGDTKGDTRFFFPRLGEVASDPDTKILTIPFEYRLPTEEEVNKYGTNTKGQEALLQEAAQAIMKSVSQPMLAEKLAENVAPEDKPEIPLLLKRMRHFSRKHTTDFFVHKHLREFLLDELEFYVRDQIVHLMDIDADSETAERKRLAVRVFRKVAGRIIDFLANIEEAQKTLFEKRKLVLGLDWLVPIQYVPEEFQQEIIECKTQVDQWRDWYKIEPKKDLLNPEGEVNKAFLDAHPTLPVDTRCFNSDFKLRLLCALSDQFGDLDEATDGILVHSENFQALNYLRPRFKEKIQCVYIDPPYNTAATQILYKNQYQHSTWLSLMEDRISEIRRLMNLEGILCVAIDDFELNVLTDRLCNQFGKNNHLATVVVRSNPHGRAMASGFSSNHEYALFFSKSEAANVGLIPRDEKRKSRYPESDENGAFTWINFRKTGAGSEKADRPKLFYPVYVSLDGSARIPKMHWSEENHSWVPQQNPVSDEMVVLPIDSQGNERVWNMGWERARKEAFSTLSARKTNSGWQIYRKYHVNEDGALPGTWWGDAKYSATESGTRVAKDILGDREIFSYPKSISLVQDCLRSCNCHINGTILDCFCGSGTTGHAVINLNREDGGGRKFILVEMGQYFDTVLVPRIAKVMYSPEWKAGRPKRSATNDEAKNTPRLVKLLRLESYDDALHNLTTGKQIDNLEPASEGDGRQKLSYALDRLLAKNDSMLNWEGLDRPFDYTLERLTDTGPVTETVDMVESFNAFYGLRVERQELWTDPETGREYRAVKGRKADDSGRILIVWRDVPPEAEADQDRKFIEQQIGDAGQWDEILCNGPCASPDVQPLDEKFKQLMVAKNAK